MKPNGLSSNALSIALRVPVTRINDIVLERRAITADTALRLARYFGTTPEFWLYLQVNYDLSKTAREYGAEIHRSIDPRPKKRVVAETAAVQTASIDTAPAAEQSKQTDKGKVWARIVAKAWADESFKQRLLSDPKAVMAEEGLIVPENVVLKMVEAADQQAWVVLPPKPREEKDVTLESRLAATPWFF
jgi:addiction module HigA family antidote